MINNLIIKANKNFKFPILFLILFFVFGINFNSFNVNVAQAKHCQRGYYHKYDAKDKVYCASADSFSRDIPGNLECKEASEGFTSCYDPTYDQGSSPQCGPGLITNIDSCTVLPTSTKNSDDTFNYTTFSEGGSDNTTFNEGGRPVTPFRITIPPRTTLDGSLGFDRSARVRSACDLSGLVNPKFQDYVQYITCIIGSAVIPLIFALALAMFIWGVVQYVIKDEEKAKKEGQQFMLWGVIALAVMISVWGLVGILTNTFGIEFMIPQLKDNWD
ncbi:MAG: pilin [Patescibacteria group bacterium]